MSENAEDYEQGSRDDDHESSDGQEERDIVETKTPNPDNLPLADPSLYYRIPPNTAGLNPTKEAKYSCSMLKHRSCMSTFHKTWQLQDHFALIHGMYVPSPRRGNPNKAAKPRKRTKPRDDHLLKQKLRNGGDFELKWWRKKTTRMRAFIVKALTKWEVDGMQIESNPNMKVVSNPPGLARILIRYPQIALPIPEDTRPLEEQIVDDERWALWESTLESFWVTNDGRIALNNVVERARMDLDQIDDDDEREQIRRACSLLEMAFPFNVPPRISGTPTSGTGGRRPGNQLELVSGGRGNRSQGSSPKPLQEAHRVNIVNATREFMSRWRQYLQTQGSRVDKDKWVGQRSLEMFKIWRQGQQPAEDYETCKMLSWRFWTSEQQKIYPDHFAEAYRGFPDPLDLCSSEEEPPLELDDFLTKKVGTNNLPKFDHKKYLKRREAKKAAREARRQAGEDVPEPQRPRLPPHARITDGGEADQGRGSQETQPTTFNYYNTLSWMGEAGQRRNESDYAPTEMIGNPETVKSTQQSMRRRRDSPAWGRKRKHLEGSRSSLAIVPHRSSERETVDMDATEPLRDNLDPFGQNRAVTSQLVPGGMTADQLSLLESLSRMRSEELERAQEGEDQELHQRELDLMRSGATFGELMQMGRRI